MLSSSKIYSRCSVITWRLRRSQIFLKSQSRLEARPSKAKFFLDISNTFLPVQKSNQKRTALPNASTRPEKNKKIKKSSPDADGQETPAAPFFIF